MKSTQIADQWKRLVIGQDHAIDTISPYINRYLAGMNSPSRPIGNFFLLGPTGTGKTRTAESLAEVLHGDDKKILKIDCGEFQLEHEVAKLIGSPPGYLGHKETQALFSQSRLTQCASAKSDVSIILFDEIEKAHSSMWRILLGILDKSTVRLGDNQSVSFDKTVIFMSSNLGATEIAASMNRPMGFGVDLEPPTPTHSAIQKIGVGAVGKKFPPEFPNRLDEIITYNTLSPATLFSITKIELQKAELNILSGLGIRTFHLMYGQDVIEHITTVGTSAKFGARELKRTMIRLLINRLADDFLDGIIQPGCKVHCRVQDDKIVWDVESSAFLIRDDGSIVSR